MYYKNQNGEWLQHHGILGQKWGKRNGPPYPLDASDHSASEKKAGWRKSLNKPSREKPTENESSDNVDNEKRSFHLSDKQKKYIKIGATVAATALVTYGAYKIGKSGVLDKYTLIGKEKVAGLIDVPGLKSKAVTDKVRTLDSIQKDLNAINPSGNKSNCVACSVAYNLRKMGFDVSARSREGGKLFSWSEVELAFDDFQLNKLNSKSTNMAQTYDELTRTLKGYGNGSSGVVSGRFNEKLRQFLSSQNATFDGHAFSWEVLNGEVVFTDGQNGKIYGDALKQIFGFFEHDSINYARMDNLKVDVENMMFIKGLVD